MIFYTKEMHNVESSQVIDALSSASPKEFEEIIREVGKRASDDGMFNLCQAIALGKEDPSWIERLSDLIKTNRCNIKYGIKNKV